MQQKLHITVSGDGANVRVGFPVVSRHSGRHDLVIEKRHAARRWIRTFGHRIRFDERHQWRNDAPPDRQRRVVSNGLCERGPGDDSPPHNTGAR
ncbi:MAG TPA: hypothetical protein VHZ73_11220 [Vicinamibacterales bacterium]|nr:hypothetical protein [Vicinamibacterales bacterium]